MNVVEAQTTRPRGNVWDRRGKPCIDNAYTLKGEKLHVFRTEEGNHYIQVIQDPKSIVMEPYPQIVGNEIENAPVFCIIRFR